MKKLLFIPILLFVINLRAQEEAIPDKQFMLWITGVNPNEQVTHNISAAGTVWEYLSGNFVISTDQSIYNSSLITIGNANFNSANWPGFNFKWINTPPTDLPSWGLGLYKVTNSKQTDKYIYLDARDAEYASGSYNPDFKIYFDQDEGIYEWLNINVNPPTWISLNNGDLVSIWTIKNKTPNTAGLQNYWNNALTVVQSVTQPYCPRLIWGPIPNFSASGYKIYWRYGGSGNFSLLATVGPNTLEYTHEGLSLGNGNIAEYKVQAYNNSANSDFTNTVSIGVSGLYKNSSESENNSTKSFSLTQNYPNPFNPSTNIRFTIPEKTLVTIKVFDILGNEIAELLNAEKDAGTYTIKFNADNLSSGLYLYQMKAGGYSFMGKMTFLK